MKCPYCRNDDTKVVDSRLGADGSEVKRRRHCPQCDVRYTTYERVEKRYPHVLKSDGSIEVFDENKIRRGIMRSVEKLNIESAVIDSLINRICDNISCISGDQIDSRLVGEEILRELSAVNDVAYIRFASVYRRFDNVSDFTQELQKLKHNNEN